MSNVAHDTAAEVLSTCIKLRGATDFKTTMHEVIKDIRELCGASYCAILSMNEITSSCSLLCEDVEEEYRKTNYKEDWFTPDFYEIAKTWESVIGGSNCIIYTNTDEMALIKDKNKLWYDSLSDANVESLVLFPCFDKANENELAALNLGIGKKVSFYQIFPLYKEEAEFYENEGMEALLNKLDEKDLDCVVNINRKNYC